MIPVESRNLGTIVVEWEERRLDATLFQTPDGQVAAFIELPAGFSLRDFAAASVNTRIREEALRVARQVPDFYEVRFRDHKGD